MQTFLPYQDFKKSLDCLDNKRLGKQRVEALQILNTLTGKSQGWKNHPAVKMWRGYEVALEYYKNLAIQEWEDRGFNNSMWRTFEFVSDMCLICGHNPRIDTDYAVSIPHWLTPEFCSSHRSSLLRKDPIWYGQFGWTEPNNLPYIWPGRN